MEWSSYDTDVVTHHQWQQFINHNKHQVKWVIIPIWFSLGSISAVLFVVLHLSIQNIIIKIGTFFVSNLTVLNSATLQSSGTENWPVDSSIVEHWSSNVPVLQYNMPYTTVLFDVDNTLYPESLKLEDLVFERIQSYLITVEHTACEV